MEDCERITRQMQYALEVEGLDYRRLEVGSPGIDRPLRHENDFIRFEGQVSVFWPAAPERRGPCYRCLFAEPPPPELAPSCAEAGVLGVLPGVVGSLEAVETIKVLRARKSR